jgi:hypothetical protein
MQQLPADIEVLYIPCELCIERAAGGRKLNQSSSHLRTDLYLCVNLHQLLLPQVSTLDSFLHQRLLLIGYLRRLPSLYPKQWPAPCSSLLPLFVRLTSGFEPSDPIGGRYQSTFSWGSALYLGARAQGAIARGVDVAGMQERHRRRLTQN